MKKLLLLTILFLGIISVYAQEGVGLRTGINIQKKVTKKSL